MIILHFCKETF